MSACAAQPPQTGKPTEPASETPPGGSATETATRTPADAPIRSLLELVARVIGSTSAEQRRQIQEEETTRFQETPTSANLLRLTLVRAFTAALPSELMESRTDLQSLATGHQPLSDSQRYLALMALKLVDQRLQMGSQIADLQRQIDSLTEIEASLKDNDVEAAPEGSP